MVQSAPVEVKDGKSCGAVWRHAGAAIRRNSGISRDRRAVYAVYYGNGPTGVSIALAYEDSDMIVCVTCGYTRDSQGAPKLCPQCGEDVRSFQPVKRELDVDERFGRQVPEMIHSLYSDDEYLG